MKLTRCVGRFHHDRDREGVCTSSFSRIGDVAAAAVPCSRVWISWSMQDWTMRPLRCAGSPEYSACEIYSISRRAIARVAQTNATARSPVSFASYVAFSPCAQLLDEAVQ
jgi:hypothetical protein